MPGRNCLAPVEARPSYHGRHEKTVESVLGPLHLERAYYHCAKCQSGFCPRDRDLRLELFSLTPGVLRMTGSTAALVSFEESSALLHELAGVEVSTSQVQRAAEALGAEIAADECGCVEKMGEVAPTMYLGMDGTGVPMRASEVAGRDGAETHSERPGAGQETGMLGFVSVPRLDIGPGAEPGWVPNLPVKHAQMGASDAETAGPSDARSPSPNAVEKF